MITSVSVPQTALKSANISFTPGPNGNTPIERFIFQKRMVTYYPDKGENKQKLTSALKSNGLWYFI